MSSCGHSSLISSGYTTRESTPTSRFTSARSIIVFTERSEWASVRCPCWENSMLKLSSCDSDSYSFTLAS